MFLEGDIVLYIEWCVPVSVYLMVFGGWQCISCFWVRDYIKSFWWMDAIEFYGVIIVFGGWYCILYLMVSPCVLHSSWVFRILKWVSGHKPISVLSGSCPEVKNFNHLTTTSLMKLKTKRNVKYKDWPV